MNDLNAREGSGLDSAPEPSLLILGYGNVDRQDDGVAWHVLYRVAKALGMQLPAEMGEAFEADTGSPSIQFVLQLTPEMAEIISGYAQVCFVDAHTGAVPNDLQVVSLQPEFQASPFTHHLTPQSLLSLSQALYGLAPVARLVSVRGYEFGFSQELSPKTDQIAQAAVDLILEWVLQSKI